MGVENTINYATAVVLNAESKHLNGMTARFQRIRYSNPNAAELLVEDILEEKKRLDPKLKYDHEEYFISTGRYTRGRYKGG